MQDSIGYYDLDVVDEVWMPLAPRRTAISSVPRMGTSHHIANAVMADRGVHVLVRSSSTAIDVHDSLRSCAESAFAAEDGTIAPIRHVSVAIGAWSKKRLLEEKRRWDGRVDFMPNELPSQTWLDVLCPSEPLDLSWALACVDFVVLTGSCGVENLLSLEAARSTRDQAAAAGVPFWFNGWNDFAPEGQLAVDAPLERWVAVDAKGQALPRRRKRDVSADEALFLEAFGNLGTPPKGSGLVYWHQPERRSCLLDGKLHRDCPDRLARNGLRNQNKES